MKYPRAIIVVDLGYGDGGKGTIVDALTERHGAHTVVRFNGGAQAGHTVVTPEGRVHTFAQWGSGTFLSNVRTFLSEYMLVDPLALISEEQHLKEVGITDGYSRMYIDERALLVTPFARALNRLREYSRGGERHGSCGMGIGETVSDANVDKEAALRAADMMQSQLLMQKLESQRVRMYETAKLLVKNLRLVGEMNDEWNLLADIHGNATLNIITGYNKVAQSATIVSRSWVTKLFQEEGTIIFEGAQGVLIDQDFGFHPYTTWSDTTTTNAINMLHEYGFTGETKKVGVLRSYAVRHGPGPFPSESEVLALPDSFNVWNDWQRDFRIGHFDAVLSRYALRATKGVDVLAITNLDRVEHISPLEIVTHYQHDNVEQADEFLYRENSNGKYGDIKIHFPANLEYQTQLAVFLQGVKTVQQYIHGEKREEEFISEIVKHLEVPVHIIGRGPTRLDKAWEGNIWPTH